MSRFGHIGRHSGGLVAAALRSLMFLAGLGCLAVGLRAAWRSDSATAALVVGAVLIFLALVINRDLEELSGRYKDASITYRRRNAEIAVALEGAVASDDVTVARDRVQRALAVARATEVEAEAESRQFERPRWYAWAAKVASMVEQGLARGDLLGTRPDPMYSFNPASEWGERRVVATMQWIADWQIRCTVTIPDGRTFSRVVYGEIMAGVNYYNVSYPGGFEGAPPLESGQLQFEWGRVGPSWSQEAGPVLIRDWIEITDDQPLGRLTPRREQDGPRV